MPQKSKVRKLTVGDLRKEIVRRLDCALENVRNTESCDDATIHDARRNCKRIRAFLELFADFDKSIAKKASRHVRDAARELSPFRDRQIIPEAIQRVGSRLKSRSESFDFDTVMKSLTLIESPSRGTESPKCPINIALTDATKQLKKAKTLVKSSKDFDRIRLQPAALRRSYEVCRKHTAIPRHTRTSESFHNLRKAVKTHLDQCQFIAPLSKSRLKPRIKVVRNLGELLGSAQDIIVLRGAIAGCTRLDSDDRDHCMQACEAVANELQSTSIAQACELYFDAASAFIYSLDTCKTGQSC